jgi:putative ABC transport system ATP-binding protein
VIETTSLYVEPERPAEPEEKPALECHDVFRIFKSGPVETVALRGLDLTIERREIVAVLGPSGSGKSTFLQLAAGLDTPSAGDVRAFGDSLAHMSETDLADYRARKLALVFQSENLWPTLTALENVRTAVRLAGSNGDAMPADEALARFGLSHRMNGRPAELSGGEQQRVAIAAAAARRAPLVLADEPTGELDHENEAVVLGALRDLRDVHGSTVIVVTHSHEVADAADRVIELRDGKVMS